MSIRKLRYILSWWLFDLAARIHPPLRVRMVGQAHWVGNLWLSWSIEPRHTKEEVKR